MISQPLNYGSMVEVLFSRVAKTELRETEIHLCCGVEKRLRTVSKKGWKDNCDMNGVQILGYLDQLLMLLLLLVRNFECS